jgi:hypothetical protein
MLATRSEGSTVKAAIALSDGFNPSLEELIHRKTPWEPGQFSKTGETAFVHGPLNCFESALERISLKWLVAPNLLHRRCADRQGGGILDFSQESLALFNQSDDHWACAALPLKRATLFLEREFDRTTQ